MTPKTTRTAKPKAKKPTAKQVERLAKQLFGAFMLSMLGSIPDSWGTDNSICRKGYFAEARYVLEHFTRRARK